MIKVRLQGLPAEVEAAAAVIRSKLWVINESRDYPNRGESDYVRRYIDAEDTGEIPGPPLNPQTAPLDE